MGPGLNVDRVQVLIMAMFGAAGPQSKIVSKNLLLQVMVTDQMWATY